MTRNKIIMAMVQLGENALFHFVYQKLTHREEEANDQPWDEQSSDDSSTDEDEDEVSVCCYFSLTSSHVVTKQVIHRMKAVCNLNPFSMMTQEPYCCQIYSVL